MSENEQVPYKFDLIPVGPEVRLYGEESYPYRGIVALKWPGTDELQGYTTTINDGGLELPDGPEAYEDPIGAARGCMIALGIAAVLWAMGLAWGWWVIQRLLGILGG